MTSDDPKPCPKCGDDSTSWGWDAPGLDGSMHTGNVECHECGYIVIRPTSAEAIAAWNTRAALQETSHDA